MFASASRHTCWPCGFVMEFDDAGGAALGFRQFISVPFLDGSKRYVSARKSEDENARFVGFIFKQDFYIK
jgi:hypothetical protein